MKSFELFYFPSCPFCQLVLSELPNMKVEVILKNIMENTDFRNELMAGGGKTQVPCLKIIDNGNEQWLYESRDIVDYLGQQ
ncbi:glutaredoxin domain-containing protein [Pleionea sediminis]|uniref:glutaredoxin domain-containing protein n=1 Tax=Pleionea sediminis TaxID=2569479 RepID=UPI0011866901|nr:glutaredoxin domain-containing protein [Pleionea sediminis]